MIDQPQELGCKERSNEVGYSNPTTNEPVTSQDLSFSIGIELGVQSPTVSIDKEARVVVD